MTKLTKLIAPALAASLALGVAAPASAGQAYGYGKADVGGHELRSELRQFDRQIDAALYRHQITRKEAARFNTRLDRLQFQLNRFARDGLTRWEVNTIDNQLAALKHQLRRDIRQDRRDDRRDDRRGGGWDRDGRR